MAFRTVVISSHSKIEYSLNYFVFRTIDGIKRIHLDEISTVIFETTNISITSSALVEMLKRKINIIFCDEKHNPFGQLVSLYGAHNSPKRIKEQISWTETNKGVVWQEIVRNKIRGQYKVLTKFGRDITKTILLENYFKEVDFNDITNREGHAAKIYFNFLYHEGFSRTEDCNINLILNYGYSLILSLVSRAIVAAGYLTQLGIHHKNDFNEFNFACDLMEPFRPYVDIYAKRLENETENIKDKIKEILNEEIPINGQTHTFINAINIYCNSVFDALNKGDANLIKFPESYDI